MNKLKNIWFYLKEKKRTVFILAGVIILHIAVISLLIGLISSRNNTTITEDKNTLYETRSELLKEAIRQLGAHSSYTAAEVWGKGLCERSAAMQLSVMNDALAKEYLQHLEVTAPNWVVSATDIKVNGFSVIKTAQTSDKNKLLVLMEINAADSSNKSVIYKAILTVILEEDGYWRIAKISMDDGLYAHTGFYLNK